MLDVSGKPTKAKMKERIKNVLRGKIDYFESDLIEWSFSMFAIFAIATSLLFASCHEQSDPPTLSDRLEGYWIGGAWHHPNNLYYFHGGAAWAAKVEMGVLTDRNDYAYSESGDTLKMLDVLTFERSEFVVSFPTDSTVTLDRVGGLKVNLKRL